MVSHHCKWANAFTAFANEGKRQDSHLITKIVGPTGNSIAERETKTTKVTSKKVANEMTSMLLNVVETGTGKKAYIPDIQIAGKTGSTQLPFSGVSGTKDQWMVGYTPNIVGAIWMGYDQTDQQHYLPSESSSNVVPIFKEIIKESSRYLPKENFEVVSINAQLAGEQPIGKNLQNQAREISKELNANAKKIGSTIKEQAPEWKRGLEKALYTIGKGIDSLINKTQSLRE
jgi:penicillin-binding protein 2A